MHYDPDALGVASLLPATTDITEALHKKVLNRVDDRPLLSGTTELSAVKMIAAVT